jgi:protein-S-isoprenylcysteine O-methyltransferase Ste14
LSQTSQNVQIREYAANVIAVIFCIPAFYTHYEYFIDTGRPSGLFQIGYISLIIFLFLFRRLPARITTSFKEWTIALTATCLPLLLRPSENFVENDFLLLLQILGTIITITALINLNRSFGLVPADRGIQTSGLYRIIRHPVYAGYFIASGAYVVMNASVQNIAIYMAFIIFECLRSIIEEEFLSHNPVYRDYKQKVRWRIIPLVF